MVTFQISELFYYHDFLANTGQIWLSSKYESNYLPNLINYMEYKDIKSIWMCVYTYECVCVCVNGLYLCVCVCDVEWQQTESIKNET